MGRKSQNEGEALQKTANKTKKKKAGIAEKTETDNTNSVLEVPTVNSEQTSPQKDENGQIKPKIDPNVKPSPEKLKELMNYGKKQQKGPEKNQVAPRRSQSRKNTKTRKSIKSTQSKTGKKPFTLGLNKSRENSSEEVSSVSSKSFLKSVKNHQYKQFYEYQTDKKSKEHKKMSYMQKLIISDLIGTFFGISGLVIEMISVRKSNPGQTLLRRQLHQTDRRGRGCSVYQFEQKTWWLLNLFLPFGFFILHNRLSVVFVPLLQIWALFDDPKKYGEKHIDFGLSWLA